MGQEKDYRIKVINSLEEWREISVKWNNVLLQSSSRNIFLTWEWLYSWGEYFLNEKRKLFVLLVYKHDELIGIAPWYIQSRRLWFFNLEQITFLGGPETGSDYLDVFTKRGKEKEVALSLYDFLFGDGASRWDYLELRDIPSDSYFLLHFLNKIEEDGKYVEIRQCSFSPFVVIRSNNENAFLPSVSAHRRKRYKRDLSVLKKMGEVRHSSSAGGNIEGWINAFFLLYAEKSGYSSEGIQSVITKFANRCNDENWIQIDFLKLNGVNIAGFLHLSFQGVLCLYLMAVDKGINPKISIGNILVGLCLEKAVDQGMSAYDFLKGAEDYKCVRRR